MAIFPDGPLIAKWPLYYLGYKKARVSTLCAKASVGGKNGYAFNIVENGSGDWDGSLIEGALPKWNIYANNSPGEWVMGEGFNLKFRLKHDASNKYCFSIGNFRGHNTDAPVFGVSDTVVRGSKGSTQTAIVGYELGEYDFTKVNPSVSKIQVLRDNFALTDLIDYPPTGTTAKAITFPYTISAAESGVLNIGFCNQLGDLLFYLPNAGSWKVEVASDNFARIRMIHPAGSASTAAIDIVKGSQAISGQMTKLAGFTNTPALLVKKEISVSVNGTTVYTETQTSNFNPTLDTTFFSWVDVGVGSKIGISAAISTKVWSYVQDSDTQILITMTFE